MRKWRKGKSDDVEMINDGSLEGGNDSMTKLNVKALPMVKIEPNQDLESRGGAIIVGNGYYLNDGDSTAAFTASGPNGQTHGSKKFSNLEVIEE